MDIFEWLTQRNLAYSFQTAQANPERPNGGIVMGHAAAPGQNFQGTAGVYPLPTFNKRVNVGPVGYVIQNANSPYNL